MPHFCQHSLKFSYEISKNPFRIFIWVLKSIEFHLKQYEITQPSARYPTSSSVGANTDILMSDIFLEFIIKSKAANWDFLKKVCVLWHL